MISQGGYNVFDHIPVSAFATADMDLRLGVHRPSLIREPRQRFRPIAIPQQRSSVTPAGSLGEYIDRRVEPDRDRAFVEQLSGPRVNEGAAAGCNDPNRSIDETRNKPPFSIPEVMLAKLFEQLRCRRA